VRAGVPLDVADKAPKNPNMVRPSMLYANEKVSEEARSRKIANKAAMSNQERCALTSERVKEFKCLPQSRQVRHFARATSVSCNLSRSAADAPEPIPRNYAKGFFGQVWFPFSQIFVVHSKRDRAV
jgi:hypothetical protein